MCQCTVTTDGSTKMVFLGAQGVEPEAPPALVFDEEDHLAESQALTVKAWKSTHSKMNKRNRNLHCFVALDCDRNPNSFSADLQMRRSVGSAYSQSNTAGMQLQEKRETESAYFGR